MISTADMRKLARWPAIQSRRLFHGERIARVLSRFQSIGETCEFGLAQRRWGVDQLGLFRFAGVDINIISTALEDDLAAFAKDDALDFYTLPTNGEWIVHVVPYGMAIHTWTFERDQSREKMAADQTTRLRFQARRFLEDLEDAEKIFVFRTRTRYEQAHIDRLLAALRRGGPNTLLWVEEASSPKDAGELVIAGEGMMRARISRLAPDDDAHDADDLAWIDICERAVRLRETMSSDGKTP